MEKLLVIGAFVVFIGFSFFAGNYFSDRENARLKEQQCHTMIVFAIDKLDDIKIQYDADNMEAFISFSSFSIIGHFGRHNPNACHHAV